MTVTDGTMRTKLADGTFVRVDCVASHTFRVRYGRREDGADSGLIRYGIIPYDGSREPAACSEDGGTATIRTASAALSVDKRSGHMRFTDAGGAELLRTFEPPSVGREGFGIGFVLDDAERLYGMGDITRDRIQKRGLRERVWVRNKTAYVPVPFLMSSRGWALMTNTTWDHEFDLGCDRSDRLGIESEAGSLDLFVFAGSGYAELLERYTNIAGRPTLMPIWAYGLTFICHVMANAREVIDDALKFRGEGIPCDLIGLDSGWTERANDYSTEKSWHSERFYSPKSNPKGQRMFIDSLRKHGFKLSLYLGCDHDLSVQEELEAGGQAPVGGAGNVEPWYAHLQKFVEEGVVSFKLSGSNQLLEHPERQWGNGMSDAELHNLYPLLLAKQMHRGYSAQTGLRPMIYTSAGFMGIQRYAATWNGSSNSHTETVVSLLNHTFTGHAHTTCDMYIHSKEGIHFGFLLPWSQINSWAYLNHPSFLDSGLKEQFKAYARLRYRLLPYLYSAAHHAARTGMPIMRAMPLHYPDDPVCENMLCQYMLGDSLLVAAFTERVYLPEGRWIDFWTDAVYEGPAHLEYSAGGQAGGPLFVRAGAILPMWKDMDYIGQSPVDRLTLHIYPHGESEGDLYEDDGVTLGYREGQLVTTRIRCRADEYGLTLRISPRAGGYAGMPARRSFDVLLHGCGKPSLLRVGGVPLPEQRMKPGKTPDAKCWRYDRLANTVGLYVEEDESRHAEIVIELTFAAAAKKQSLAAHKRDGSDMAPLEQSLEIALDTGDAAKVVEAWARLNKRGGDTGDGSWRISLLNACLLIVRKAEQHGWAPADVYGPDYESVFNLQRLTDEADGSALLNRLAQRYADFANVRGKTTVHALVRQAVDIVSRELEGELSLLEVSERLHTHPSHLSRLFKRDIGSTFSDYVLQKRMERGKTMLLSGMKVYEAANAAGFKDTSYFSRVFAKYWGVPPTKCRP